MPPASPDHAARHIPNRRCGGYSWRVELISFLHYGLVSLLVIATIMVLWFAGYVVYRLYND